MRGSVVVVAFLAACASCASFTSGSDDAPTSGNDAGADADANRDPDATVPEGDAAKDVSTGAFAGQIIVPAVSTPAFIAANEAMVVYGSNDGAIWRADVDGKTNGILSTYGGSPRQILIEGTEIIWGDHTQDRRGIWRFVSGMAVRTGSTLSVTGLARFAGGFATFDNSNGILLQTDDTATNPSLVGVYNGLYDLTTDGADIIWTVSSAATVMRLSPSGTPKTIAENESDVRAIARSSDAIYWSLGNTKVRRFDRASSVRSDVALAEENVHGLIADDSGVYWLTKDSLRRFTPATGQIDTLATGFETPLDNDANLSRVRKIALTSSFVFFLTNSDLRRVAK